MGRSPRAGRGRRRPGRLKRSAAGFTLVEVVLVALLTVIIVGVMFASFFVPVQAIRSGKTQVVRLEEAVAFFDRLAGEVAAASFAGDFHGTGDRLSLVTAAGTDRGLERVVYLASADETGDGVVLYRAAAPPWGDEPEATAPVFQAESFRLAYYDGHEWHEEWEGPAVPRLVSLEAAHRGRRHRFLYRPRTGVDSDPDPDRDNGPGDG